jgi:hypothetical protein
MMAVLKGTDMPRDFLTYDEAVALLPDGDSIHCFISPSAGMLVGADWSRAEVLKCLELGRPELAGPAATGMGHGLCCGANFFQTKEAKR